MGSISPHHPITRSTPDNGQHLIPPALHLRLRGGFEVQAEERLVGGGADVEVPVGVFDRDAVAEVVRPVGIARLDARDRRRRVGHPGS